MVGSAIQYPSALQTSVFSSVRVRMLPLGSRTLPTFTITTAAPAAQTITTTSATAANATTIAVSALSVTILAGTVLTFPTAVNVTVVQDALRGATTLNVAPVSGTIASGGTASYTPPANAIGNTQAFVAPIPISLDPGEILQFGAQSVTVARPAPAGSITLILASPLTAALAAATNATTQGLLEVVGATDATPSSSPNAVDAADFQSGAGAEMFVVSTSRTLNLAFNRKTGSLGAAVLMYLLYDDQFYNREVYARVRRASGEIFEGAAIATSGDGSSAKQTLITQNCNLQFQGASFRWTPATAENLVNLNVITAQV